MIFILKELSASEGHVVAGVRLVWKGQFVILCNERKIDDRLAVLIFLIFDRKRHCIESYVLDQIPAKKVPHKTNFII